MHLLIQQRDGVITNVTTADVAAQLRRSVPIGADPKRLAAYLEKHQGQWVAKSDYEKGTQLFEPRLLLVIDGQIAHYPADTLVIAANKLAGGATFLIDLLQNWTTGKYRIADNQIVAVADWQEPTLFITADDLSIQP